MTKYYLLKETPKGLEPIGKYASDISFLDLETMLYTKEEYLQKLREQYKDETITNIFLAKVKENQVYDMTFYPPLFIINKDDDKNQKLYAIVKNRSLKALHKEKSKILDPSSQFRSFIANIMQNIISDDQLKYKLTTYSSSLNLKLKEEILQLQGSDYNWHLSKASIILQSYMEMRKLIMAYFTHYDETLKLPNILPENYPIKSSIFNYQTDFYLTLEDVNNDPNKLLDYEELEQELKNQAIIENIKKTPFDDPELEKIYEEQGIEGIKQECDGNKIYSATMEDLLRMEIISDREYLNHKQALKRK